MNKSKSSAVGYNRKATTAVSTVLQNIVPTMSPLENRTRPRLILGLMTFGPKIENGARITDINSFNKALDVFQARGYNEVDTARAYVGGRQEAFTKEARWKERGLKLATKVKSPSNNGENSAERVLASVETSLAELGTDSVDIIYLHRPDRGTPMQETLEAINKLHKAGKFKQFAVSNFTAFELAEAVMICKYNGWVLPTLYQGMYNMITRNIEPEVFAACRRYGLDIVVYNQIGGGLFSGRIKSQHMVPEDGRFSDITRSGVRYRKRYYHESIFQAMKLIEGAIKKHSLTMIETALRWIVHHSKLRVMDGNDGVLIGVSSLAHLDENIDDLEKGPLPADVVEAVEQAWQVAKAESSVYWYGELEYTYDTIDALFGPGAK